jgi:uncharacterized protein YqgC (DUF456 family)
MSDTEIALGIAMLVGLVGTVVPIVPGLLLIAGAALVWGLVESSAIAWFVVGAIVAIGMVGIVLGATLPARRTSARGAPSWVVLAGAAGLVVGFFAIPVIGALIGFPVGILVAELVRLRDVAAAWRSTREALKDVGLGIAIQLTAAVAMIGVWAIAVLTS